MTKTRMYASGSGALSFVNQVDGKASGKYPSDAQVLRCFRASGYAGRGYFLWKDGPYWFAVKRVKRVGSNVLEMRPDQSERPVQYRYYEGPANARFDWERDEKRYEFFCDIEIDGEPHSCHVQNLSMRAALTFFLRNEGRIWEKPRRLSNEEMADLPSGGWINPKVDVCKYYVTFTQAWEVDAIGFKMAIVEGVCGQKVGDKYILVNH